MKAFAAILLPAMLAGALCAPVVSRAQEIGTQRISGSAIEHLAKRGLAGIDVPGDCALVPAASVSDQIVPAGGATLVLGSAIVTPSYVNVPVEIDIDGAYLRTMYVGFRVQQYIRTAVAANDLPAGSVLAAGDVTVARVPFVGRVSNGTRALIGRKLVVSLHKGQPVYLEETVTNQIVTAGSSVVLIVNDGGVSVVAEAVARTGGGLGDQVNVYNPATNKTLSGTVVGPNRVQLDIFGETIR